MTPKQIGGGPAFPGRFEESYMINGRIVNNGISRREWFAAQAPITMKQAWSLWADGSRLPFGKTVAGETERRPFMQFFAELRFEYADAMLKEAAVE